MHVFVRTPTRTVPASTKDRLKRDLAWAEADAETKVEAAEGAHGNG